MATANFKKFDVKHGISVNGLPFVDENRNVVLNNLTVQGVSTIVDTRTVSQTDPIISIGGAGKSYFAESISTGSPGRIFFDAEAFDDIAIGDSIEYNVSNGTEIAELTNGDVYYVKSKETDVTNSNYRSITISSTQGGPEINFTTQGAGFQSFTLNPLQDLTQDLGIEFNYVDGTAKKGFFGYKDSTGNFTFLLNTTYGGSSTVSDTDSPVPSFSGTKAGVEVKYIKLEPSVALTQDSPGIDLNQTWDHGTGDIVFQAIDVDILDTASNAESKFLDFAISNGAASYSKFLVRKDGALALGTAGANANAAFNGFLSVDGRDNNDLILADFKDTWIDIGGDTTLEEYIGINLNVANTASALTSKLVNFYSTDERKYELYWDGHSVQEVQFIGGGAQTAVKVNLTDTLSDDNSYLLDLQRSGVSAFRVRKDGFVEINGPGEFHDTITIETENPSNPGVWDDNTQLQTDHVNVPAGTTTGIVINSFPAANFVTAKLLVQVKQGSTYHSTELMLVHDGVNVYLTEYGTVYTSDIIGSFDASISGNNVNIIFTKTEAAAAANAQAVIRSTRLAMVA